MVYDNRANARSGQTAMHLALPLLSGTGSLSNHGGGYENLTFAL